MQVTNRTIQRKAGQAILLLVWVIFAGNGFAAPQMDDFDLARLQDGEILLQTLHSDKPGGAARVTALFHTTADEIWRVLGDCRFGRVYIRGLKSCEILESGQERMLIRHRVRNSWYTPTLDFTFEALRKSAHLAETRLIDGDLRVFDGVWRLQRLPDSDAIIVIHEIRIQSKMPAPRWLVRRSVRKDLPNMLACMRGLANASIDSRDIAADLRRCPGDISNVFDSR